MSLNERLTLHRGQVLLDGDPIGSIVRYGRHAPSSPPNAPPKTVFAARVYQHGLSISDEGATSHSVLNKIRGRISKAKRAGQWPAAPSATEGPANNDLPDQQPQP